MQHNGLGRKSSLMLLLHKVKPLIYKRYVPSLLINKEFKSELQDIIRGIAHDTGDEQNTDYRKAIVKPIQCNWADRMKTIPKKRLPIINNVQETSFDDNPVERLNKVVYNNIYVSRIR